MLFDTDGWFVVQETILCYCLFDVVCCRLLISWVWSVLELVIRLVLTLFLLPKLSSKSSNNSLLIRGTRYLSVNLYFLASSASSCRSVVYLPIKLIVSCIFGFNSSSFRLLLLSRDTCLVWVAPFPHSRNPLIRWRKWLPLERFEIMLCSTCRRIEV